MKLILGISILCALLISCGICSAQVNVDLPVDNLILSKNIVGKWQMDEKSVLKELRGEEKEKQEKMPDKVKYEIERSLASKIFSFSSQGVFSAEWISRGTDHYVTGKYIFHNGETLGIFVNGSIEQFFIEVLNQNTMVLSPKGNQRGMLKKLFFTRISE